MKKAQYFYLLRRGFFSGGGLDSDYQAVLDQATTRGFTAPSRSQQLLQSNLVKALKNAGVWNKLDLLYVMAGESENFARLNWKAPANYELANSGTPTFTSNKGFSNGGGSNYLDTTFNFSTDGSNYTLNDAGAFVAFPIMSTTSQTNNRVYGNEEPTSANFLSPRIDVDGADLSNRNWINGSDYQDPTTALDFHKDKHTIFFQNRTDSTTANYRSTDLTIDDVKSAEDTASISSSLLNDNLVLLQAKGAYLESTATIGLFGIGSSLTAVEMAAVETAYYDNYYLEVVNAPVNTVAPAISGTAERGEILTATTGTWTGTGTLSYAYQWTRDGVDISGATASTYTLLADDDNADIYCSVIAIDDEGSASADSNTLGPVLGEPTLLVAPVASGTPEVDQVLTTTDGTWQGKPTIAITYQWRRNTVNISGATSNTYTLVSADLNALVDCQVTATNSIRSVSADTNDLGPIQAAPVIPAAPSISGVPTIAGTAKVGETLTATAASATGEPTPTTSWQWERSDNGTTGWASISGATSNTYTAVSADESKYLRVVQTETNTEGSDSANSAATAQVAAATDADYQAVLDRASTLGYTAPSSAQQTLQNTLVEDLKTAGIWSKLDVFYVFATDGDSDYATLNWKSPSNNQTTKVNSPTFTADSGFTGDGISSYLDTNFQPVNGSQYAQDSAHFMIYSYGDDVGSTYYGGALDTTPSVIRSLNFGGRDNNNRFGAIAINSTGADVSSTNSVMTDVGFNLITRTSSTSVKAYKDNSLIGTFTRTSDTSSYQLARNIMLLARNLNGSANSYGTRKLAIVAIGSDVDSLASDYYTAINDYFTAL